jgi:hypothetical protein
VPIHIEEMTSEVTVVDGELPLSEAQVERLVLVVLKRLEGKRREAEKRRAATELRSGAAPPARVAE